ncbi:MAG TPA: hypothetical protein VFJ71_06180 [Candidatus Limnocylindrales bacterium]|nr:hypothetical protein [Candidatus Limnocylindrales bacterium]
MGALMDLVAGDEREILLAISVEDWAGFDDRSRFDAHLALGGGLDPTWLDLFSEAVRSVTAGDGPADFIDARRELDGPGDTGERVIERVDPGWIDAVARIADHDVDAVAGRWIDLVEEEIGFLPREEKPWIRQLAGDIVRFARAADRSSDVLFAWSL